MADHSAALAALRHSILESPGRLPTEVRRRLYLGESVDSPLDGYAARVRTEWVKLAQSDIDRLKEVGCSEDEIFEATLATALGAADHTLLAALRILGRE